MQFARVSHMTFSRNLTPLLRLTSPVVYYLSMTSLGHTEAERANTQVRAINGPVVPPLLVPHYAETGPASSDHLGLSHCLRNNIFPGATFIRKSLTHESFISHPLNTWHTDPRVWYGHKTNDMVEWTERNIMNQKLSKMLTEMEKRCTTK